MGDILAQLSHHLPSEHALESAMIARLIVLIFSLFFINFQTISTTVAEEIGKVQKNSVLNVTASDAHKLISLKPEMIILDIRTSVEFKLGHIKGAKNIDFYAPNFKDLIAELDPEKVYLVHCRSGNRSTKAMPTLQSAGLHHIVHMNKGFKAWKSQGLQVVRNQ
ncbi:MAG: rhodanese-like domain-containing protein [Sneathiella sp.]